MSGLYIATNLEDWRQEHTHLFCPKCNSHKLLDDFHKSTKTKTGRYSCCKECRAEMDSNRHAVNRWRRFLDDIDAVLDKYKVKASSSTIYYLSNDYVECE